MSECDHNPPVVYCTLCKLDAKDQRIAILEAENHALETERDYWMMTAKKLEGISAENAKLREAAQAVVDSDSHKQWRKGRVSHLTYMHDRIDDLAAALD
jgi:hypothetical protein